ncbi:hypothetical protein RMCBS344292_18032 [Rhizopus microsporus]|nr:hypothetical protein RMCBS344292_18032 [Rhizopus microsporus]
MGHLGKYLGYISIFLKEKYENISDYDYAKNNSYKLLCLSSQLLKEAAQYNAKTWSTLPRPSHGMECNNAMIELKYGWKTDGHMVAILFKRKTVERIPQDEKEMDLLNRRVNLANWSKGLYPLKKEPTGLSMTDRIMGIDPGLRDIFVMADGSSEDVNNKKTVKERSVKFANNEYKVRSGFDWSKQVELKNREAAGMQAVYDEIPSLDSGDSNTILNYLQVLSKNRKKDTDIVKPKDICIVIGKLQTITCANLCWRKPLLEPHAHWRIRQAPKKDRKPEEPLKRAIKLMMAGEQ